jgi:hypothetical protein
MYWVEILDIAADGRMMVTEFEVVRGCRMSLRVNFMPNMI